MAAGDISSPGHPKYVAGQLITGDVRQSWVLAVVAEKLAAIKAKRRYVCFITIELKYFDTDVFVTAVWQ
jgi:hypothetical protein